MNLVLARLEESTATFVQSVHGPGRKKKSRYKVCWHAIKHGVEQDKSTGMVEQSSFPASKLLIHLGNEWSKNSQVELDIGEWQAQVYLREISTSTLENLE